MAPLLATHNKHCYTQTIPPSDMHLMDTRIFKTRTFSRWMNKAGVTDASLIKAIREMEQGLIDAELGGYLFKKRVALLGQGKRGGARTIVASRLNNRWFFLYGFLKNERDNIGSIELKALQGVAKAVLELNDVQIKKALTAHEIIEVQYD
jgi:hypothetical protein